MKLVSIEWIDSVQPTSGWQFLSEYKESEPIKCISVGFLVCDKKDVKGLAQNIGNKDGRETIQASGIIHIPSKCITKIKKLKI